MILLAQRETLKKNKTKNFSSKENNTLTSKKNNPVPKDKAFQIIIHALGAIAYIVPSLLAYILSKDLDVKKHARVALNWQISLIAYNVALLTLSSISAILMNLSSNIFIIFPFSLALGILTILNIVFSIFAAFKASEGKLWKYPITINFIESIGEKEINRELSKGKKEVKRAIRSIKKEFK